MLIWPAILLIGGAVVFLLFGLIDPSVFGVSRDDSRLIAGYTGVFFLFCAFISNYGPRLRVAVLRLSLWAAVSGIVFAGFVSAGRLPGISSALSRYTEPLPTPIRSEEPLNRETTLLRAWDGHYRATAEVDGRPVELLFDTGASLVILRNQDAARIGINTQALAYEIPVTTANGRSHVARVTLEKIRIGEVVVENVRAAVAEPGRLHASLLGMSFIEALRETVIRGNQVILRQ